MNSRLLLFFVISILALLLCSCDDVIERDIADDTVTLIAPMDNSVSNTSLQQFWWEGLEGSNNYRLQIVSPSFENAEHLVLDSLVEQTKLSYNLLEGRYEWKVIGTNDAYESLFEVYTLEIRNDSSANLSTKFVNNLSPVNGSCTSSNSLRMSWDTVAQAQHYNLQIASNESFTDLLVQESLTNNFYDYELPTEDQYFWRVRGENQQTLTFTSWSVASITLDQTSPEVPVLLSPLEGANLIIENQSPDLTWSSDTDSSADTLYIYADEAANGLVLKTATSNSAYDLEDSPFDFSQFVGEDFFWEVVSSDKAGNQSVPGELRLFFISN